MFAASFIGCLAFIGHAVALDTTFHQSIRPINCTISNVQTGSTTITDYSAACGRVIVPGKPYPTRFRSTESFPSSGGMPSSSSPQLEAGRGLVYLSDIEGIYRPGGVTLLLKKDLVYTFRVEGDNALFAPRTLEVFHMTVSSVDLQLSSYEGVVHLAVGKGQKIDVSNDGAADAMFRMQGFQSPDTALVRVGLLTRPNGVIQTNKLAFALSLTGVMLVVVLTQLYHRRRLPPLGRHWRVPHIYHQ